MATPTTLRNATLQEIADVLKVQADSRYDVVAHSESLRFEGGNLMVSGTDAEITMDGVTPVDVCLTPTDVFDAGLAQRLDIPIKYLRKMRATTDAEALLDANVNEWLARSSKQWFVRGFKSDDETCGIARAFLSDRFNCVDNFDVLMAALDGIRAAGVAVNVVGCDLSERRMSVRIEAPEVSALAPALLANYRSPFSGDRGADNPTVFAGFVISNSETGGGAFTITPRLVVQVCRNGMTITKDALRKVHLGSQMDEGVIRWGDDTSHKNTELVTMQARDAVSTFCDVAYVESKIAEIEESAGVTVAQPTKVIERVGKALTFTKEEQDGILGHFIQGGDLTAGGVMHSVTSFAQTVLDPDRAGFIEESGLQALVLAGS